MGDISHISEFGHNPAKLFDNEHEPSKDFNNQIYDPLKIKVFFINTLINSKWLNIKNVIDVSKSSKKSVYLRMLFTESGHQMITANSHGLLERKQVALTKGKFQEIPGKSIKLPTIFGIYDHAQSHFCVDKCAVYAICENYMVICRDIGGKFYIYNMDNFNLETIVDFHKVFLKFVIYPYRIL